MLKHRNALAALALVCAAVIFMYSAVYSGSRKPAAHIRYMDFTAYLNAGGVSEVVLTDKAELKFRLHNDAAFYTTDNPRNPQLKESLLLKGVTVSEAAGSELGALTGLIIFAGVFYFASRRFGIRAPLGFDAKDVSAAGAAFADVAGNDEAKDSVRDLVDFLKSPEKYLSYGARMPRGIIFHGSPGTGKTLLARAVAGEAGVPFYAVSGSDFVQMYVGVGAGRIRELFKRARGSERAVIFIDEIDALGRRRSTATNGGSDERDQTLNALLTEMSGFNDGEGIVVIAATNRLDTLDEALLRPGRFDRQVEIALPDRHSRESILTKHAANKPLAEEVSLGGLARDTVGFSGAMLENLLNEAAIEAAKAGTGTVTKAAIERAYYTVLAGSEKKDRSGLHPHDREVTAYHEAGHAIVSRLVAPENVITRVSIIPNSKGAGGFCVNIPPDRRYRTKRELEAQVMISFGGRAAEELVYGGECVTTGASGDIENANRVIRDYVIKLGMSRLGPCDRDDEAAAQECRALLSELYSRTVRLLSERMTALNETAAALLKHETMDTVALDAVLSGLL